jgi:hypothetical protein
VFQLPNFNPIAEMRSYKFFPTLELDSKLEDIPSDIAKQSAWKKMLKRFYLV